MKPSGPSCCANVVAITKYIPLALRADGCTVIARVNVAALQPPSMAMPLSMSLGIRIQRSVAQSIQKAWCIIHGNLARYVHSFISD